MGAGGVCGPCGAVAKAADFGHVLDPVTGAWEWSRQAGQYDAGKSWGYSESAEEKNLAAAEAQTSRFFGAK